MFNFKPAFGVATTSSGGLFGGSTAFGTAAAPSFGTAATTQASGFGGTGFGFGGTSTAPAFGTTTTAAAAAAPAFSFGATPATTSAGPFASGFGTTGTVAPSFLSGTATGFSATPATTSVGSFGGFSGFGTQPAVSTGFGTAFGTGGGLAGTTGTGTGLFGATTNTAFGLNTTQPSTAFGRPACQVGGQPPAAAVYTAVSMPVLFGDERDAIIAKWNQLQAFWGTGRGYFNQQGQYVDFTPDNPYSFFKAVGYNCLPSARNEDGLVALTFDRKMKEVCDNQQAIVDTLQRIIVNNQTPTVSVCVEGTRPLLDDKTEMVIYLQQRANTGVTTRVAAAELFNHLNNQKQLLQTQLSISAIIPRTGMTEEQKKLYLDNPPAGIDARIWEQAKKDNPDPATMIPVPMVGFSELHSRLKHQEQQTSLHQARLDLLAADIAKLQQNQADVVAKTEQYKRNQLALGHRILKILVKQEIHRKHGYSIQADDEVLRVRFETIHAELNAPMQFKGRLNELMSQMRLQNQLGSGQRSEVGYHIEPAVQQEIKKHLKKQHEGVAHLISIIKEDMEELKQIEQGLLDSGGKLKR